MVHVSDHVLDRLITALRVQRVLDRVGRLDQVVYIDAGPFAEHLPEQTGQVEEKRLDQQEHGNPLVVAEILLDSTRLTGNRVIRQVVRV